MEFSQNITEIAPAMAKAWGETPTPKHNKEVTVQTKQGGKYTFNYTTLAGIMDAIREPFKANGLFVIQDVKTERSENSSDTLLTIKTFIYHTSGEYLSGGELTVKAAYDMQGLGGQITYLKRYSLSSVLGLATEQDDDGNSPEALAGYTQQPEPPQNGQNGAGNRRNNQTQGNTRGNNKNAASEQETPKKDNSGPAPMTAAQKTSLDKQIKNLSHELMIKEEQVWERVQHLYHKPGKATVPERSKLTAKWADALITALDKHVAGEMELPPVPTKEKGAEQDGKAKEQTASQ